MNLEHGTRLSDNPWRYNEERNLMVTDEYQNQQYNEAIRQYGHLWATEEVERFVVQHQLNDEGVDFRP